MKVHEHSTVYFVVSSGWGGTTKLLPPPLLSLDEKARSEPLVGLGEVS